ncbi:MAG TPA: FecR domain-containing protein [Steroidobacteraceae bacterium]|nr:FecR domain-containing protein [Steroidobacteraceae bacterium]
MSDIVRLKTQTQIDNEAAVWTWRLDSGELTAADRAEFDAWLRVDSRHRRTLEELSRTWSALDRLGQLAGDERIAAFARPQRRRFLRREYWGAAAAAVLMIAFGATLWMMRRPGLQVLSTAIGQQRHLRLADGSQLTLNTNTLLAVRLTPERRDVYLRRGEAHFDVVHDAARPFFVHAGDAVIRDIGTQFEVRMRSDRDIDVLVNEGRVEVQGPTVSAGTAIAGGDGRRGGAGWVKALSAGEQLLVAGPHLEITPVSPRQMADDLAWREGALVFEGEPLSEALAEVARYTRAHIVLTRPEVGSLHISGRFRTDDVPGFFQALQAALPVRVSRAEPGMVYIAPR